MPFKSEAQRRYFYYKASQPGAEGKKWKKELMVKTSSKEKIAVGKEIEMLGHLLKKTKFKKRGGKLVATGQGMQKKIKDLLLKDIYPKQKSFLSDANKERAATAVADFFADPVAYAASAVPYAVTGYPIPGAGVAYVAGRHKLLQALNKAPKPPKTPGPIKTASRAKGFAKFRHMTRDIQSLADASLHSPDVLLWRSIGRKGPIERRIVVGAPIEYQGARFKTPFYSSTGTGSKNVRSGEMVPFNWVEGKKPSADRKRKRGQGLWINKYFDKKQPPPGHPLHLQKLRLEAMDRKGLLTPTHVVDEYKMGAGRRYAGPFAVNSWLQERGHHRSLLPAVKSDLQSILKYIEDRSIPTKTASQVAFDRGFYLEMAKIAEKVGLNSPQGRAMAALLGAGTFATVGGIPATLKNTYDAAKSR